MNIALKKFGTTLVSRQNGREAFAALQPQLSSLDKNENLKLDFEEVVTFSPSWGDEFLSPLLKQYGTRLILLNTNNPSVEATLELLNEINHVAFLIEDHPARGR